MKGYRVHFTDNYGQGAIDTDKDNLNSVVEALRNDPTAEDIWYENLDNKEECEVL